MLGSLRWVRQAWGYSISFQGGWSRCGLWTCHGSGLLAPFFVRGPTVIRWGLRICFFPRRLCIVSISAAHWYIHALTLTASSLQDWMAGKYFLIASWQSYRDWYILSRSPELVTFLPFESFGFVILSIAISVNFWFSSTDSLESPDSI